MAKQTFGGDDDQGGAASGEQSKKRINLFKFASRPDMNIRDTFWAIIRVYAAKKDMKNDIKIFNSSRVPLMRIALTILGNPQSAYHGLSVNFTSLYSIMMMLDGGWKEEFREFIRTIYIEKKGQQAIATALRKLLAQKQYKDQITSYFKVMIGSLDDVESVLAYIHQIKDRELVESLKKEIMIIAKNDVGISQINAMNCVFLLKEQSEVQALLAQLLMHWDETTREHAAFLLRNTVNNDALKFAKSQVSVEANPKIKKMLEDIIKKNNASQKQKQQKPEGADDGINQNPS